MVSGRVIEATNRLRPAVRSLVLAIEIAARWVTYPLVAVAILAFSFASVWREYLPGLFPALVESGWMKLDDGSRWVAYRYEDGCVFASPAKAATRLLLAIKPLSTVASVTVQGRLEPARRQLGVAVEFPGKAWRGTGTLNPFSASATAISLPIPAPAGEIAASLGAGSSLTISAEGYSYGFSLRHTFGAKEKLAACTGSLDRLAKPAT